VHSEDREELQRHLMWNSHLPNDRSSLSMQEVLLQGIERNILIKLCLTVITTKFLITLNSISDNCQYLERNFTVRFRCLLDNTSGFLVSFSFAFSEKS